jgi:hypothetical protein
VGWGELTTRDRWEEAVTTPVQIRVRKTALLPAFRVRSVRASHDERVCDLPGDHFIPDPLDSLTHATTIAGTPQAAWPWLVQMGAGRAGWYSYDALDNGGQASAIRILPQFQAATPGTVFPALPHVTDGFVLLAADPPRSLVLGWPGPDDVPRVTWAFVLQAHTSGSMRLIVRVRGARDYRFHGLPSWLSGPIVRLVHHVMQRKQLLGIAWRVETTVGHPRRSSHSVIPEGRRV